MDSFLNMYFLFQVFIFQVHEIQRIMSTGEKKNGYLKGKVHWPSAVTLGFKSLVL